MENNYNTMVRSLKKNPRKIKINAKDADIIHMLLGLTGEVGELVDAIKKHIIYEQPLDIFNVREELGDIEFYLEGLRQALGLQRDDTLLHNMIKLNRRYSKGKYTNEEAKKRRDK